MSRPSYWLEDVDASVTRPRLEGHVEADVVIVGAGFTGLWTAWYLLEREPGLDVVVVEAEYAGYGASGRNGAWCSPNLAPSIERLVQRSSVEIARRTVEAMREAVDEVASACDRAGIDSEFRKGGILRIARGEHELPAMRSTLADLEAIGAADGCRLLDRDELRERVRVHRGLGAFSDPNGAVLHPGKLVRGLADAVGRAGGQIFEDSAVTEVEGDRGFGRTIVTGSGSAHAPMVVLATEAWLSTLPGHARDVMPLYSLIVLTEPVPDELWEEIGWRGHECLSSHRYVVDYLSRTTDGRILFGGRGAPYHFGSAIDPRFDHHGPTHANLAEHLVDWFPALRDVGIEHRWGGALGMPRDWMPSIRVDRGAGLAAAYGYTGQGVATANLAGRVLAEWIVEGGTEFEDLPLVGHRPRRWEPEPLRWLAARYLQWALHRVDERAARTGRAPTGRTLAERLVAH